MMAKDATTAAEIYILLANEQCGNILYQLVTQLSVNNNLYMIFNGRKSGQLQYGLWMYTPLITKLYA